MKTLVYLVVFIHLCYKITYAQQYFDYSLDSKKVSRDKKLNVGFSYNLDGFKEEDFLVRPVISRGTVKIYDEEEGEWITQSGLWTAIPELKKEMELQVNLQGEAELYFEVQNTIDQKIYKTPKEKVWGGSLYGDYLQKLNRNIKSFKEKEIEQPEQSAFGSKDPQPTDPGLLARVIKYISEII